MEYLADSSQNLLNQYKNNQKLNYKNEHHPFKEQIHDQNFPMEGRPLKKKGYSQKLEINQKDLY